MPTFVEDYGDRRGYGNRLRGRVRNFYEQVQTFNKAAFGRINRLAGEDIDGAVLVERKAQAADPRKTLVPAIASQRCISSRHPSGYARMLGEGKRSEARAAGKRVARKV